MSIPLHDLEIFYSAALCWVHGINPYTCGFIYPLPVLFLFLPFLAFPLPIAKLIWSLIGLIIIVAIFKRMAFWYVLYAPVLRCFAFGQIDLFFLPALFIQNGISMALLTLKPQLVWLYFPFWFWKASNQERLRFGGMATLIWGVSFIIWPEWIFHFATRPVAPAIYTSPSLFGGNFFNWGLVVTMGIILMLLSRDKLAATTAGNPFIQTYDLVVLLPDPKWWLVPLSWVCQILAIQMNLPFPYVLLALSKTISGEST